jgi:hypothetical protein|tara:strand:- start:796 stop:2661 length:1866 start_codon:yes stop_codon:yes gene_type:complete
MPFTKFTNLDFDQIKTSIKDYLRANSTFTDFDFEGSNFSVLIDTLAYNTYITAFNSNMVVNESFLDSSTLRENVVSLARNIGYVPRSKTSAKANVSFSINTSTTSNQIILKAGLVCVGAVDNTQYTFSVPSDISANVINGVATFDSIDVFQGTYLTKEFVVDNSQDQRFILSNPGIDTSTIVITVGSKEYKQVDNIVTVNKDSEIYLIQEVSDERYELLFGDGIIGKKLETDAVIKVSYITTDGQNGNGPALFSYAGTTTDSNGLITNPTNSVTVTTNASSTGGGDIEQIDSIKYFAPRVYASQYRAVTARDYEAIIQKIFPSTESVSVVGGEELDPPEFGKVVISIKPKNGFAISDFAKTQILNDLKQYTISGIKQELSDLKLLFVEVDSDIFYDSSKAKDVQSIRSNVITSLNQHSKTVDMNKFGGRFKYSKILQIIDNVDNSITSNITRVRMRRNLNAITSTFAQYEICYGNRFHKNLDGYNVKSTGFKIAGETDTVYFLDVPNPNGDIGLLSIVKPTLDPDTFEVVKKSIGTVDYKKGEIIVNTINIVATDLPDNVIEIQAVPESNDVIGLKDLYLIFDISKSNINMVRDTIASGEQISGVNFPVRSSYSNGQITRK